MSTSTRWLAGVGVVVAIVVVLATVLTALADDEQEFSAGSPEATVQSYLRAVADSDATTAFTYLSPELLDRCGDFPRDVITQRGDYRFRATLVNTVQRDGTVEIEVDITERWGDGPFGGGESTWSQVFVLSQEDGTWLFTEPPWPTYCPNPKPMPAVPGNG